MKKDLWVLALVSLFVVVTTIGSIIYAINK